MLTAVSAWPLEDSSCSMTVAGTLNRFLRLVLLGIFPGGCVSSYMAGATWLRIG